MLEKYEGAAWTEEERGWMFTLIGEFPPSGIPELGFASEAMFDEMSEKLTALESELQDAISRVAEAFPEEAAEAFEAAVGLLTGAVGGKNVFDSYRRDLRTMGDQRNTQSQKLQASIWEIWAELATMLIEIAISVALAPFTGGASLFQATMAKIRAAFNILMSLHRLLSYLPLGPSIFEMFEEMLQSLAVNLAQLTINPPEWRPDGVDWKNVGVSGLMGLAAGGFTHLFTKISNILKNHISKIFKKNFDTDLFFKFDKNKFPPVDKNQLNKKKIFDNPDLARVFKKPDPVANVIWHVPVTIVAHGAGEGLGGAAVMQAVYGQADWGWNNFVGPGVSSLAHEGIQTGLTAPGHWLHTKIYPDGNLLTKYINKAYFPGSSNRSSSGSGGSGGDVNTGNGPATGSDTPPVTSPPGRSPRRRP